MISQLDMSTLGEGWSEGVDPGGVDWVGWLATSPPPPFWPDNMFVRTVFCLHVIPVLWIMPCTASKSTQFWGSNFVGL